MLPGTLLALREGIEASLIISLVLGSLHILTHNRLKRFVWLGAATALLLSMLAAAGLFLARTAFGGKSEAAFEGASMLFSAAMLTWMILWVRKHASANTASLHSHIEHTLAENAHTERSIFLLSFLAVLREGLELAIFLFTASLTSGFSQTLVGAGLGLAGAVIAGSLFYSGATRLNLSLFFKLTGALLILFAAGLVGQGLHEFVDAGFISGIIHPVWDTNRLISQTSPAGSLLKSLFGYNSRPSLIESITYFLYFGLLVLIARPKPFPQKQPRA